MSRAMSATRLRKGCYFIESVAPVTDVVELTSARDLPACMSKLRALLVSGHQVSAIFDRSQPVTRVVLETMVQLARRRAVLGELAHSFRLSLFEAEQRFGGLLLDNTPTHTGIAPRQKPAPRKAERALSLKWPN